MLVKTYLIHGQQTSFINNRWSQRHSEEDVLFINRRRQRHVSKIRIRYGMNDAVRISSDIPKALEMTNFSSHGL